ncbi:MAG TPA: hypothetical protein VFU86_16435 [Terriglobales bacterium]|nr:hypothetical protein [Terriglobales bacterium]
MIFGFNTDIKSGNTIYHVQSEAREHECLLQTQIFVRGHCIGKKAASYAELTDHSEFTEARMHEMLKSQHRDTVESVRAGQIDEALTRVRPLHEVLSEMSGVEIHVSKPVAAPVLILEFLNSAPVLAGESVHLRFRVLDGDKPVSGAKLISKVTSSSNGHAAEPVFAQAETEGDGCGEVRLPITINSDAEAIVLIQATHEGKSAMKKFRLSK